MSSPTGRRCIRIRHEVAGEHQFGVGVLVVDDQQTVVGGVRADRQRQEADEVVVVADLLRLLRGGQGRRIERRGR